MASEADNALQIGRYTLVRRIGKGGMGEVWLGKSSGAHGFEKSVAIKRILPQFSSNLHVVNMLVDEARISVLLNHPNIVQVHELGEEDGDYYIVMEYVDGHALSRLLRKLKNAKRRLDHLEACYVAIQILEGLHAAHIQKDHRGRPAGIIHRDVSPQNVLVSMEGVVKVIDFGIARARERLEVTQGASVKGKLRYMAPEQLSTKLMRGKSLDPRVDVFSAGIVLFEMLAMRQRFSGDGDLAIMDAILKEDTPDLAREGLIDRELMNILDTALEKNRDERFPDAATFAAKLRAYLYKRDPGFTTERLAKRMREAFGAAGEDRDTKEVGGSQTKPEDVDDEQTRTAFNKDVGAQRTRGAELPSQLRANVGGAQSNGGCGCLLGVLVLVAALGAGFHFAIKPRFFPSLYGASAAVDAGPEGVVASGAVDVLIEAEPHTTRIGIAGKPEQRFVSPARIAAKAGETLDLVFEAEGYQPERHSLVVARSDDPNRPSLRVALQPLAVELIVRTTPKDALVTVNGVTYHPGMLVVPGEPIEVKAEHAFAVSPKSVSVTPKAAQPLTVDLVLESAGKAKAQKPTRGSVVLVSEPPGALIFVDGRRVPGKTPLEMGMASGPHKITLRLDGNEKTFNVDVQVGVRAKKTVAFE